MGFRPSSRRTNSSPPRGPRLSGGEYRNSRPHERRDSRNWDRDTLQDRDRSRSRSRSPYSRRVSDRRFRRPSVDRPERYDPGPEKYSSMWKNQQPDYQARDKGSTDLRSSTSAQHSRSASPFHAPDHSISSEATKIDSVPDKMRKDRARQLSKGGAPSDGNKFVSTPNASKNDTVPNVNRGRNFDQQIPGLNLAGTEVQISPTSPPISSPRGEAPPTTSAGSLTIGPTAMHTGDEAPAGNLGLVSKNLAEEAANLASLKLLLKRAERNLQKRNSEFERSKSHHEKYPDIKESHGSNKKEAEKAVNSLKAQVKEQEVVLADLALRTAGQSIPDIIAQAQRGGGADREKLDQVVKTCAGFKGLLDRQQELILALHKDKKEREQVEILNRASKERWEAELNALSACVHTAIPQEQQKLQTSMDKLSNDFSEVKTGAVELGGKFSLLSTKLEAQALNIATLSNRTGDLSDIREQLEKLQDALPEISRQVTDLSTNYEILSNKITDLEPLKSIAATVANDREISRETLKGIAERLRNVELRPDISSVESRFQHLERLTPRPTPDVATKKELDALKDRVKRVEETPSPRPTPKLANAQLTFDTTISARLQTLEHDFMPLSQKIDLLVTNGIFELQKSDVQALVTSQASQERIQELERRIGSSAKESRHMNIEQELHLLREELNQVASSKVEERLQAVRGSPSASGNVATEATSQSHLSSHPGVSNIETRICALERDQNGRAASTRTSSETEVEAAQLILDRKIAEIANDVEILKAEQEVLQECIGTTVTEGIEMATAESDAKIDSIRNQLSLMNSDLESLKIAHGSLHGEVKNAMTIVSNFADPMTGVENKVAISLKSFSNTFNQETLRINNDIQGLSHGLNNLGSRFENINTRELSQNMLAQLADVFPNLQSTETSLQDMRSALSQLGDQVRIVWAAQNSKDAQSIDTKALQDLRTEIANVTKKIDEADTAAIQAEETAISAKSGIANLREELFKLLEVDRSVVLNAISDSDGKLESLRDELKGHDEQIQALKRATSRAPTPPQTRPQGSNKTATTFRTSSNGSSTPGVNPRQTSRSSSKPVRQSSAGSENIRAPLPPPTNRQSSVTSAASDSSNKINLKRKHLASASAGNSFNSSKSHTPERKRPRLKPVPDSDDDPDYDPEDTIPQPQMGSDDDE